MTHPVDIHVGQRLKEIRRLRGLSQMEVARALNLSFQQVQKYEKAANRVSASKLFTLAQFFDVSPLYFFEGLDETNDVSDPDAAIMGALSSIKDASVKERLVTLIKDVSGQTVSEGK